MAAVSYLDASAITKLAIRERETDALENEIINREALFSSRLGATEAFRAARRFGSKAAMELAQEAFDALFLLDVTADILDRTRVIEPRELKTGDAIHLATALSIGDPEMEFITYDTRQAQAARALGLRVVQPGLRSGA